MVIEMSLAQLDKLQLTPNEFLVITLIRQKEFVVLSNFLIKNYEQEQMINLFKKLVSLNYLTSTSFLQNGHDYSRCRLSNDLYALLKVDSIFEEFLETYPISVVRTDGVVDYLRTDQKSCRNIYMKITNNNRANHEHILKCLNFEIDKRKKEGSMKFMVRMSKWLVSEAWKSYQDEINNLPLDKPASYGTEIE